MSSTYQIDTPEMRFAIGFVKEAGQLMRGKFNSDPITDWKSNETPVTDVDNEINQRFIEQASQKFPGYSILGEEASQPVDGAEWTWVIDPLDGTGAFVQGLPAFTCCLALLQNGTPVLGVIYDPMLDRLFYAQKGQGAYMNDRRIRIASSATLDRGFVHLDSLKTGDRRLLPMRQKLLEKGCVPMMILAIQYGFGLICAGRATGAVFSLPSFWDVAPAYIIGTEAGAVATDLYGHDQRYDQPTKGFILANPQVHKELVAMVAECLDQSMSK